MPDAFHAMIGRLIVAGVRGAAHGDSTLEADLEACRSCAVKGIVLFDVDAPSMAARLARGEPADAARANAVRNIINPAQTKELIEHIRHALGAGAWVAVDQEGGRVARLRPERGFLPSLPARDFARLEPVEQAAEADRQARQLADLGFRVNFAPCVDLAINPENPVIAKHGRAFSDDPGVVTGCAEVFIGAHRRRRIITCIKHFPGHGSAGADSHLGLVDVTRLADPPRELLPFRNLIRAGMADMVMTAHILNRSIDPVHPATLSPAFINDALRRDLGYHGVVITDSLDMRALADSCSLEESVVRALNAGVDLLLHAFNAPPGGPAEQTHPAPRIHEAISRALRDGRIAGGRDRILASARRVDRLFTQ